MSRDDEPWDDVMEQVRQALIDQVQDEATRQALLDGLSEGLSQLDLSEFGMPPAGPPDIQLVEGGHQDDDPTVELPRPELHVIRPEDEPTRAPVVTRVRVLNGGDKPGVVGVVHVQPDQWQTVFRGADPRPYRLVCSRGVLRVALEGAPADRLEAGQSMDVEARLIRVGAEGEAPARGHYERL